MNTGYSNNSSPSLNGLIDISADTITTDKIVVNGFDVTSQLIQVPINTGNITTLQQITTGISYSDISSVDMTTISNNLTITGTLTTSPALATQTYCNTQIANLVNSAPASLDTLNELATAMGNDANFSTTVINSLATKASLAGANLMDNSGNVFYGDGSNLKFNNITMTSTNGIISTSGNNNLTLSTPNGSTGGLFLQTQGLNRLWIAGGGASRFYQWVGLYATDPNMRQIYNTFYNLHDTDTATASGIYRGRLYTDSANCILELNAGHSFNTIIGGTNVFKVNSTALTTTGNIVLTNSAALIYATTANAYLAVGTPTGGGNLYLNAAGMGGIIISGTDISILRQTKFGITPIIFSDATGITTTIKQNALSYCLEFNQLNGSGFLFSQLDGAVSSSSTINGGNISTNTMTIEDYTTPTNSTTHSMLSTDYTIENCSASSTINFKTSNASLVPTTPFSINSSNCSFTNPPVCSIAPTTANMLCNKTYVDGKVPVLTNYVDKSTAQTITADKTFTGNIIMSDGGTNNTTIDQFNNQFNIRNNILNNSIITITGLIPAGNLNCIVRTDSINVVAGNASVSSSLITGTGGWNAYSNNLFITGTTQTTLGFAITSFNTIQNIFGLPDIQIGSYIISYIGERFVLGTYISAYLGNNVYSIVPNALISSCLKEGYNASYTTLNRPFKAGGATNASITLDYNTTTNIQCLNSSSTLLNAITVKPKDTISDVTIYGNLKLQGSLLYNYGFNINTSQTLVQPLSQFYTMNNTTAITITLPTASATITGTRLIFKRYVSAFATTFNQTGGTAGIIPTYSLAPVASVIVAATTYQTQFICAGTYWLQMI